MMFKQQIIYRQPIIGKMLTDQLIKLHLAFKTFL
jgi:hypothetical protein